MRIRIYYMYISTGFNSTPRNPHPHEVRLNKGLWSAKIYQGSCQLKALLKPKMNTPIWMSPLTHTSPTQRCCVSTQYGNDENGAEMCRRYCQSNGPRRLETKGLLHRSWVDQRLCFCILRHPEKHIPQYSLRYRGKSESFSASYVFRNACP